MKSLAKKLLAFTFVIALFTGCASVTDPGLEAQPENTDVEVTKDTADKDGFSSEQDMSPIYPKPE